MNGKDRSDGRSTDVWHRSIESKILKNYKLIAPTQINAVDKHKKNTKSQPFWNSIKFRLFSTFIQSFLRYQSILLFDK